MAKKEKGEAEGAKGCPSWMTTLGDLLTLLLTFFVLQISFASFKQEKIEELVSTLRGAMGALEAGRQIGFPRKKAVKEDLSFVRTIETIQEIEEYASQKDWLQEEFGKSVTSRGLVITMAADVLFAPGKVKIKWKGKRLLNMIAERIKRSSFHISIEGHTDDVPINTTQFPSNWELSGIRAVSVLKYLIKRDIAPQRLSAVGYGQFKPKYRNDTPEGRMRNRRVEIVLIKPEGELKYKERPEYKIYNKGS